MFNFSKIAATDVISLTWCNLRQEDFSCCVSTVCIYDFLFLYSFALYFFIGHPPDGLLTNQLNAKIEIGIHHCFLNYR